MHRSRLSPWLVLIVLAASLAGAVGCGQRGPLYLPDEPAGESTEPPRQGSENDEDAATS